eukprot:scaffold98812_cov22-Prasinocladus_malaysianus.AAC.1
MSSVTIASPCQQAWMSMLPTSGVVRRPLWKTWKTLVGKRCSTLMHTCDTSDSATCAIGREAVIRLASGIIY